MANDVTPELQEHERAHMAAVNDFWLPNKDAATYAAVAQRFKYAAKIKGFDEHGRVRVLAVDWDGVWHDLS